MYNLLLDIGNSDIKTGKGSIDESKATLIKRFSYSKNNFEKDFKKNFSIKPGSKLFRIGISVLGNTNREFLRKHFIKNFEIEPVFIDRRLRLPIKINYSESLGNDRICSAAASHKLFKKKNILIIDFGTATTYTLLCKETITGGIISPGIKTSLNSLISKTKLPDINLKFPNHLFNRSTKENIKAGVLYQSLYSAERIITEARKMHRGLYTVATGGFSELISKKTSLINTVDRNLVLTGINIIISQ